MSKAIIFGSGSIAELTHYYLTHDSPHEISVFTVDGTYIKADTVNGLPVVAFEEVESAVDPLATVSVADMDVTERTTFYRRLGQWAQEPAFGVELDDADTAALRAFLATLSFPAAGRSGADAK